MRHAACGNRLRSQKVSYVNRLAGPPAVVGVHADLCQKGNAAGNCSPGGAYAAKVGWPSSEEPGMRKHAWVLSLTITVFSVTVKIRIKRVVR